MQQYEKSKLEQKQSETKKFTLTTTTFARKKQTKQKNKKPYSKTKHCRSPLTVKHQANPISRLLFWSQEEANEVRHKQLLHVPVTDRFAILQNS